MQAALDGTGLSIVRALVRDELGGELTLVDDRGLRAEVRFPARTEERTTMRILIAEDETIIRLDLRAMLEKAGFEVCAEAKDGEEAVTLARTRRARPRAARREDAQARRDRRRAADPRGASDPDRDGDRLRRGGARLPRGRGRSVRLPREAVPRDRPAAGDRHGAGSPRGARRASARRQTRSPRRSPPARRSSGPRGC